MTGRCAFDRIGLHRAGGVHLGVDAAVISPGPGASAPDVLVDDVLQWLAERGYDDVESVTTADESITFALPHELRRKLR